MSNCIKIVNAMPQADQDALLTRLENYQAVGMTPKQAQLEAAKETLKRLEGEVVQQSARELVETPAFKAWFKDSKVVDENGKPLAVYHGTKNAPSEFTASRIGSASTMFGDYEVERHGIFAAEDPELADEYANQGERPTNQTVMPLYMAINNPLDTVDGQYTDVIWNGIEEAAGALGSENPYRTARFIGDLWGRGELWKLFDADENNDPAWNIALFKKAGYDGLRILERSEGDVENTAAWVAFEPTQVKSATGNNGDFDATNPNISKSQRSPLGFYSALSEGIAAMPTKQAMAGAWMSQIKGLVNKGAVKADEIEWSGLEDWLKLQEGKVSKEQITDFLDANGVQVQETVLGEPEKSFDIYRQERNGRRGAYIMSYGTMEDAQAYVDDRDPDEGEFMIEELADEDNPTGTKYEQYTLPGGKNYREVLLTLPDGKEAKAKKRRYQEIADEMANTTPERYAELREERAEMSKTGVQQYNSPHWDQANVLAHLRVDDRTDADGAQVLMVQEIQSDWGQDGKKKGFGAAEPVLKPGYTMRQMEDNRWRVEQEGRSFPILLNDTREGALQAAVNMAAATVTQGPPVAPFVGKTDGWLNLALKRVIIMAVEGGYDKVAFVNGEQSAKRYSLSKQVDTVSWEPTTQDGAAKNVELKLPDQNPIRLRVDGDGAVLAANGPGFAQFEGKQLDDIIGKDLAKKIMSETSNGSLAGAGLDIGGEGMKAFYNSIVPNATKALLKKLGGGQMESVVFSDAAFASKDSAADDKLLDDLGVKVEGKRPAGQPGFSITPAMREKVSAGVPLFSKRDTEAAEAAGFDTSKVWFHGTTAKDFKAFRQGKGGVNELGPGIYFTDKPMYAEAWMGRQDMGGRMIPAYLKKGDIFDLGARRDLTALAKRLKAMNPVTDAERQAKQIRATKRVTEWTPEESRIINDASMDLWRTWLLESDADLAKQIGRGDLNVWLARAGYIGAKNDNSQIPGQVVIFDARNIRSPWAKFNPKKVDSANILHSIRGASGVDQPDVLIGSPLGAAQNHPDYAAAKGGDIQAALRLAKSLVNQELIAKVKDLIGDARPVITPVIAVEASGRNKIPRAAAELLAARLGLDTATSIGQRNSPKRTGMDGIDRLFASPVFDGEVVAGQDYLLLDDTITQGGTFAALASHIQAAGGRVLGSVALTGKQYSATLKPTAATLQKLREKFSDIEPEFRAITGYGFDALTESEARYIANYKPADSLRVRVLAEGRRTRQFVDSPAADRVSKSTRQTDTEEFKTWSQGLDLVESGEEYAGGPAVFTVYHGTTHSGIAEFKRVGVSEGFLGKGPYFTTDPEDASENYAGIGPDLTGRIEREKENLYDNDDPQSQADLLRNYFESEPGELPFYIKANEPAFNADNWEDSQDAIEMLWERFAEPAASWSATNAVKGDTDGLMMKAYVRMSNPADTTGNSPDLTYELTQDDDGNVTDENGTAVDWVMAAREVGERYGIGNSMEEHIDDVLSEGGDVSMKTVFDSVRKRLNEAYDDQGELLSAGAIFSEIAEEAGYDGVIMDAGLHFGPGKGFGGVKLLGMKGVKDGTLHMVPFSATQVKSATGNSGAFDPANPDIRKSIRPEASRFDDMVYKMQNKMIDTKRVIESITATVGQIADDLNVYLQEELFHGRAAKRVADFGKEELKPLMEQIGRDGYTIADVEEYLQARHAPEANQVIAQRNPNDPGLQDGGSGMTNATAAAYMASLSATDAQKLAGIATQVDAIIKQTRQLYVDYNLESQDTVDAWERMFQNYIPLQREDKEGRMGIGQGFSVKGKETKGRTGSTRKVVDVLANIALQREKLIVRGEKNRVATALVGLATANPDPDLWSVGPPPSTRVYDPKTNTVVDRVDPMYKSRDNVLVAKVPVNGVIKEMAVVFNETDPRALRMVTALKNLDAANLEGLLGVSAKITRYFSAVNTQYNPVFGVVNLIRDVQGAMINLGETPLAGQRARIAKDTMSALAGIYADMRAERNGTVGTSAWAQEFEEFELEGGQTGFRDLFKTSSDRAEALQKILTPDAWMNSKLGKIFTVNGKLKVPMSEARKGAGWIFDWLSDYNGAMENAVRLAAYKAGKDQGMSKQQAASLAKNLTVNFNRKGQAGQQAGAYYAFFNAAMQGTARMGQTLFTMQPGKPKTIRLSSTGKKVVYGGILLGATQALLLAAAGFGDDDPPEFLRERALIIPVGGKNYVSIPMPLGFHVIPGIGRHAAEFALSGFEKPQKRIVSMIGMFMDAFNPIGNAGLSMQTVMPTAFDPFAALMENKDWTGKPIARTSSNKAIPGHTQFKDTATAPAKWLAEAINLITGGNDYVAGVLSPTPDQIDYLFGQVTGGVGRELSKVEQTVKAVVTGEELPTFKIPLAGRFFGNADSQASQASAFYDNVNKLNELETEVKGMQKDGKAAEAALILRGRPDAYLIARANVAERQVQRLRREKRELIKKGAERSAIKAKEAQITETMKRLNAAMAQ